MEEDFVVMNLTSATVEVCLESLVKMLKSKLEDKGPSMTWLVNEMLALSQMNSEEVMILAGKGTV